MISILKPIQCVEVFHLLFLDQFGRKFDKNRYALKGGCNLRFFLKSIRYSQDIDLDINTVRKETLHNAVSRLLESATFNLTLRSKQIEIISVSDAKQTDTTQRWKIQLKVPSTSVPIHTKIEFSKRSTKEIALFEPIDATIISLYNLTPIYASHYTMQTAFLQKIWALILRTETQARDVFDLYHLLNMGIKSNQFPTDIRSRLQDAQTNAMSISFEAFKSQVISYLPSEYHMQYNDPEFWDTMVLHVVKTLEELICD